MKKFYASLIGPMLGAYYPLPDHLETDMGRRTALATSKLSGLWCSIYPAKEVELQIQEFGGFLLPDGCCGNFDYDSHKVAMAEASHG